MARFKSFKFTIKLPHKFVHADILIDVDGDGDTDLISAQGASYDQDVAKPLVIMLNNGKGKFTLADNIFGEVHTTVVAADFIIGDFNLDGRPDVFIVDSGMDVPPYPGGQIAYLCRMDRNSLLMLPITYHQAACLRTASRREMSITMVI
jgi:hypothetical protein